MFRRQVGFSILVFVVFGGLAACSASPQKVAPAPRATASARASAAPVVEPAECTYATYDCDGDPANGCEARKRSAHECGPCGCGDGGSCRKGVCVRESKLASAADTGKTCAIDPSGRVACWGENFEVTSAAGATPTWWTGMKDAQKVRTMAVGPVCALDSAGIAYCDSGPRADRLSDEPVIDVSGQRRLLFPDGRVKDMTETYDGFKNALGMVENENFLCILLDAGQVSCLRSWWARKYEQQPTPEIFHRVGEVTHLAAGDGRMCAVSRPGTPLCWRHWLDTDRVTHIEEPVEKYGIEDAVEIAPGKRHTCVLRSNGEVLCWGAGGAGELGDGTRHSTETPVTVANLKDAIHVVAGDGHSCAMRRGGQVVCWGSRRFGGLGDGKLNVRASPTPIEGIDDAVSVSGAYGRTCALRRSGKVSCWGLGGLADGPPGSPVRGLPPVEVPGLTNIQSLVVDVSACATDDQGRVFCWPGAAPSLPGRGPVRMDGLPPAVKVYGPDLGYTRWPADKDLAMETNHVAPVGVALLKSGEVALFRLEGEAVDGVRRVRMSIVSGLTGIVDVELTGPGICAVRSDGSVVCVEYRADDRLDKPKQARAIRPRLGFKEAVRMAGPCVVTKSGNVFCASYDDPSLHDPEKSVRVERWKEVDDVLDVKRGRFAKYALRRGGSVFCQGSNTAGECGTGDTDSASAGSFVRGLNDGVSLSASTDQACAVKKDGHVVCWGSNALDEAGGDAPFSVVPQDVLFPPN